MFIIYIYLLIKHCVDIQMSPTETYDYLKREQHSKVFTGLSVSLKQAVKRWFRRYSG